MDCDSVSRAQVAQQPGRVTARQTTKASVQKGSDHAGAEGSGHDTQVPEVSTGLPKRVRFGVEDLM